jgi:hypothetical protein
MGFRFSRHVNTGLGRINISKSGISLSEGFRGAHITFGRTPRVTLGIPGSGLSWTQTFGTHGRRSAAQPTSAPTPRPGWQVGLIVFALLGLLAIIASGSH